jgi:hypothetical protein
LKTARISSGFLKRVKIVDEVVKLHQGYGNLAGPFAIHSGTRICFSRGHRSRHTPIFPSKDAIVSEIHHDLIVFIGIPRPYRFLGSTRSKNQVTSTLAAYNGGPVLDRSIHHRYSGISYRMGLQLPGIFPQFIAGSFIFWIRHCKIPQMLLDILAR